MNQTRGGDAGLELWLAQDGGLGGEEDFLALVDEYFPLRSPHVPLGRGDDCAVLAHGGELALSTDMFLEDVHFRRAYFTPWEVGAKALNRALSDLAAVGAEPLGFALSVMLPGDLGRPALTGIVQGMAKAAEKSGIFLAGGDTSRAGKLGFSLTVWGRRADRGVAFLQRDRSVPGDVIFLLGEAGLARAGFVLLEELGRDALALSPEACAAHLSPRPLLREGQAVARLADSARDTLRPDEERSRFSLMDVSDGLAADLPRLLGNKGASLDFGPQALHPETRRAAARKNIDERAFFLLGGEEYALAGTCPEEHWTRLQKTIPQARRLGIVQAGPGLFLDGQPVRLTGFDHFSPRDGAGRKTSACRKEQAHGKALPEDAAGLIIRLGREAWKAGLMAGFNGNISCRTAIEGEEVCLITRAGSAKARLTAKDLLRIRLPGGEVDERRIAPGDDGPHAARPRPSTETPLHAAVYTACPASRVILHVHPPRLLALSLLLPPQERLDLPLPEARTYREQLGHVPPHSPGSSALAEAVGEAAREFPAIWMERHGLVVHGADAASVLALAEELEQLATVRLALLGAVSQ